jgi:anaerobic selenocysteine-containing dehydrogenase
MHPSLAAQWSIAEGETVEVATPRGRLAGVARLDDSIPLGMVAVTTLFGQLALELQTSEEMDPMSRVPALDILPARLSRAGAPAAG